MNLKMRQGEFKPQLLINGKVRGPGPAASHVAKW